MSKLITDECISSFITNHYGKTDISTIGDGTVTGAISTLNTNIGNLEKDHQAKIDRLFHHWATKWNDQNKTRHFYVKFRFTNGDKGSILMCLLGAHSGSGTVKVYLPIKSEIEDGRINGSTIKTYASSAGFNGQVIQINSDGTYTLVVTNIEGYATVDMFSAECELLESYFAG